jgi:hypothetical protein
MKTDRFADSIRRKLDSIRPEFSERDWTKMQAMLKQTGPLPNTTPTSPRMFSGSAARLIAAGAAGTALFLGTTLYQTYELNRLRNSTQQMGHSTVQVDSARTITTDTLQVTHSDAPPVDAHSPDRVRTEATPAVIRDTVFVDRYIRIPVAAAPDRTGQLARTPNSSSSQSAESAIDRESTNGRNADFPQRQYSSAKPAQTANRSVDAAKSATVAGNQIKPASPNGSLVIGDTGTDDQSQSSLLAGHSSDNRVSNRAESVTSRTDQTQRTNPSAGTNVGSNGTSVPPTTGLASGRAESAASRTETSVTGDSQAANTTPTVGEATGSVAIVANPIQVQPVQPSHIAWEQRLQQRSRRMRPTRTVVVSGPTVAKSSSESAPETPKQQSISSLFKVRVGAGSDLNGRLWSVGGYAELLAGRHITLSIGLSRASFDNGKYITEGLFNQRYQQGPKDLDFRREFDLGKRVDPRHEIININLQTVRLVMPLTIGYRLPINSSFAITPTLGTILNLQSQEQVSYIVRRPPSMPPYGGYSPEYSSDADCQYRKVSILNNAMLGATVEWQRKHWGLQAGPILTIAAQPDPDWVSSLSGGIRARAFFQF